MFMHVLGANAAEDEEVDVTSVDPIPAFCSRSVMMIMIIIMIIIT